MKYIWFHYMEFVHNKAVVLLMIVQFIFSMTCWQLAYSVTKDYLYLNRRLSHDYKYSVRLSADEIDSDDIAAVNLSGEGIKGFGVNYRHTSLEDGSIIDIGCYTKETFTDFDFAYSGEKLDVDKNYVNAIPAYVSYDLSRKYKQGEYVMTGFGRFYICGYLKDKSLFYMSRNDTSNLFLAAYDRNGYLQKERVSSASAFFTSADSGIYKASLSGRIKNVTGIARPDWNSELSGAFAEVSGLLIISVWVIAISLAGLFSNNMLTFENNRRSHAAQLLMGATKRSIIGIYIYRMLGAMTAALPVTAGLFNLLTVRFDKLVFSYGSVLFSLLVGVIISLMSVFFIGYMLLKYEIVDDINI
ncbi:MAG: hypothetical protein ACI4JW_07005 [Oscillospiraceae bacterium]